MFVIVALPCGHSRFWANSHRSRRLPNGSREREGPSERENSQKPRENSQEQVPLTLRGGEVGLPEPYAAFVKSFSPLPIVLCESANVCHFYELMARNWFFCRVEWLSSEEAFSNRMELSLDLALNFWTECWNYCPKTFGSHHWILDTVSSKYRNIKFTNNRNAAVAPPRIKLPDSPSLLGITLPDQSDVFHYLEVACLWVCVSKSGNFWTKQWDFLPKSANFVMSLSFVSNW